MVGILLHQGVPWSGLRVGPLIGIDLWRGFSSRHLTLAAQQNGELAPLRCYNR